jgi:hypothetical protein
LRKLMILVAMVAVALLAASPALAQDEPAVVADAKAKEAKAGGAKAEAECKDGVIEAKAGGVVAKAPCAPPRRRRLPRLRPRLRLRRPSFRRPVVPALPRCSRLARALCWWPVASWPVGSSGSSSEDLERGRGRAIRPRPFLCCSLGVRYSEFVVSPPPVPKSLAKAYKRSCRRSPKQNAGTSRYSYRWTPPPLRPRCQLNAPRPSSKREKRAGGIRRGELRPRS